MPGEEKLFNQVRPFQALLLFLGLMALVAAGIYHTYPLQPSSLNAPPGSFSSARAMRHVWQIGVKPHPTGSYENEIVRNYLVAQLKGLGFEPEIQSALVVDPEKKLVGRVHNIVVRVPGKKPGKALLLVAHYDSVHNGPGAADDGASVAAILETLRALKTNLPLQNDVVSLFTDSEESGLLGAEAFVKYHPLAKEIGLVLNFEYRGNQGAFMMFETSTGNGKLIESLAKSVPFVLANSLMYEVYKRLPNDTDFSVFKRAGIPGLNFAAIEGLTHYHTALDRPEALDQGTLQHEGEIMLALAKHFGNLTFDNMAAPDHVYFDLPGMGLVHYPVLWLFPLDGLLLLFFGLITAQGVKKKVLKLGRVLSAAIFFPTILLALVLASRFLWLAILYLHPEYQSFIQGDIYNSHWYLIAFMLINMGLFRALQIRVYRWLSPWDFTFGIMLFWLALNLLGGIWLPGASFLLFWPLTAMLSALGAILFSRKDSLSPVVLMAVFMGVVPGILIFAPLIRCLYIALTPNIIAVDIVFLAMLLGLLTPLLEMVGFRGHWVAVPLLAGFFALIAGTMTSGFDMDHPRQHSLFYAYNRQAQMAYWVSTDKQLDPWTAAFFNKSAKVQALPEFFGDRFSKWRVSPAPVVPLNPPRIEKLEDVPNSDGRKIKVLINCPKQAPRMKIWLAGADVLFSKVAGEAYSDSVQPGWRLDTVGLLDEELSIEMIVQSDKSLTVNTMCIQQGLENVLLTPIPLNMTYSPTELSGAAVSVNSLTIEKR